MKSKIRLVGVALAASLLTLSTGCSMLFPVEVTHPEKSPEEEASTVHHPGAPFWAANPNELGEEVASGFVSENGNFELSIHQVGSFELEHDPHYPDREYGYDVAVMLMTTKNISDTPYSVAKHSTGHLPYSRLSSDIDWNSLVLDVDSKYLEQFGVSDNPVNEIGEEKAALPLAPGEAYSFVKTLVRHPGQEATITSSITGIGEANFEYTEATFTFK